MDEINKQYVLTAKAKGLDQKHVLYGHVFRNAMLIVISGFPGLLIKMLFTGSLLEQRQGLGKDCTFARRTEAHRT